MEAGLKKKISSFWEKISEQKSGQGGVGWDERSLFLQEERCPLLEKDFLLKPKLSSSPCFDIKYSPSLMSS